MHKNGQPTHRAPQPAVKKLVGSMRPKLTLKQACFQGYPESAVYVQIPVGSRNSASRNAYHTSLRPSSLFEPRHPSLKVVRKQSPGGSFRQRAPQAQHQEKERERERERDKLRIASRQQGKLATAKETRTPAQATNKHQAQPESRTVARVHI